MTTEKIMTTENETLSAQQATAILQFLQRTQMQGAEMPAYVDVFNALSAIAGAESQADKPDTANT